MFIILKTLSYLHKISSNKSNFRLFFPLREDVPVCIVFTISSSHITIANGVIQSIQKIRFLGANLSCFCGNSSHRIQNSHIQTLVNISIYVIKKIYLVPYINKVSQAAFPKASADPSNSPIDFYT